MNQKYWVDEQTGFTYLPYLLKREEIGAKTKDAIMSLGGNISKYMAGVIRSAIEPPEKDAQDYLLGDNITLENLAKEAATSGIAKNIKKCYEDGIKDALSELEETINKKAKEFTTYINLNEIKFFEWHSNAILDADYFKVYRIVIRGLILGSEKISDNYAVLLGIGPDQEGKPISAEDIEVISKKIGQDPGMRLEFKLNQMREETTKVYEQLKEFSIPPSFIPPPIEEQREKTEEVVKKEPPIVIKEIDWNAARSPYELGGVNEMGDMIIGYALDHHFRKFCDIKEVFYKTEQDKKAFLDELIEDFPIEVYLEDTITEGVFSFICVKVSKKDTFASIIGNRFEGKEVFTVVTNDEEYANRNGLKDKDYLCVVVPKVLLSLEQISVSK